MKLIENNELHGIDFVSLYNVVGNVGKIVATIHISFLYDEEKTINVYTIVKYDSLNNFSKYKDDIIEKLKQNVVEKIKVKFKRDLVKIKSVKSIIYSIIDNYSNNLIKYFDECCLTLDTDLRIEKLVELLNLIKYEDLDIRY